MDEIIIKSIYDSLHNGEKVALATIDENLGSSPRKIGSMMAVWQDGRILGSVGGGKVEYEVIQQALECLKIEEDKRFDYKLNEKGELGMICGGDVKVFIKILKPKSKLLIVGGGHIGEQLFKYGRNLNFYTVVFDDREDYANRERFEGADEIILGDIGENLKKYAINEDCYIAIATRGQPDIDALRAVISRGASYIGMIGSAAKVITVMKKLKAEGIPEEELKKVYAPMGINISSELPQEIGLAIMAEIMLIKNKGSLAHRKELKKVDF